MAEKDQKTEAAAPARPLFIGGRTLLIDEPSIAVNASIGAVIRRKMSKQTPLGSLVNDPAFSLMPLSCQVEAAREAAKAQVSGARPIDGQAVADQFLEPDVLAFAIWCCAKSQHEGLTLEEVREEITEDNAAEVLEGFLEASGMLKQGPLAGLAG